MITCSTPHRPHPPSTSYRATPSSPYSPYQAGPWGYVLHDWDTIWTKHSTIHIHSPHDLVVLCFSASSFCGKILTRPLHTEGLMLVICKDGSNNLDPIDRLISTHSTSTAPLTGGPSQWFLCLGCSLLRPVKARGRRDISLIIDYEEENSKLSKCTRHPAPPSRVSLHDKDSKILGIILVIIPSVEQMIVMRREIRSHCLGTSNNRWTSSLLFCGLKGQLRILGLDWPWLYN